MEPHHFLLPRKTDFKQSCTIICRVRFVNGGADSGLIIQERAGRNLKKTFKQKWCGCIYNILTFITPNTLGIKHFMRSYTLSKNGSVYVWFLTCSMKVSCDGHYYKYWFIFGRFFLRIIYVCIAGIHIEYAGMLLPQQIGYSSDAGADYA
jgi:hypothetical protein